MEKIIEPVAVELIKAELTKKRKLMDTIETGLMIRFSEINLEKKERHIRAFIEKRMPRFRRINRTDLITPEIEFK